MGIEYGEGASGAGEPGDKTFGTELRRHRGLAGLSLTQLAALIHYSRGHISRVENGEKRPSEEFARACDQVLRAEGELLVLAAGPGPGQCPYPGLVSFRTEDARWFFGRDRSLSELLSLLGDSAAAGHPLMVVGASGVGKTSLLRAGLAPAVPRGVLPARHPGTPEALCFSPTSHPLAELRQHDAVRPLDSYALVIVDQFEEVFALCADADERMSFIDEVCRLAGGGLPVVVGIRADFYGHALGHPRLLTALRARSMPLGPMTPGELRTAITEPAAAAGLALEPGLTEILLRDLGAGTADGDPARHAGALPLLSHTLRATWQHRSDGVLTVGGYERTGGIRGAVAATAERAYGQLTEGEQLIARRVLLSLVRVGDGTEDTRRRAERRSLAPASDPSAVAVVEMFTSARLLTADTEHVEISHEALLRAWPRLREWIDKDRVVLCTRQQLTDAAERWADSGREPGLLYRGTALLLAEEAGAGASGPASEFLAAARIQENRHIQTQARFVRRLRHAVAALAVLLVLAVTGGFVAAQQRSVADSRTRQAWSQRAAARADQLRDTDPAIAAQVAVASRQLADTPEARSAVLSSGGTPIATRLPAFAATVTGLAVGGNDTILVTADAADGLRLWDLTSGYAPAETLKVTPSSPITALAFSGHTLVTAHRDGGVRRWQVSDARTLGPPTEVYRHPDARWVAVSADGRTVASADGGGRIRVHRPTGVSPIPLSVGSRPAGVALSGAGDVLASGDASGPHAWHLGSVRPEPMKLEGSFEAKSVAVRRDGQEMAFGGDDHNVWLWTGPGPPSKTLHQHREDVSAIAYTPGGTLVTGSVDRDVLVWRDRQPAETLRHPDTVVDVRAADRFVVTRAADNIVRIWRLPSPVVEADQGNLQAVAYRPDGKLLATAGWNGTVGLWRTDDPRHPRLVTRLKTGGEVVFTLAIADEGRLLATGDKRGQLTLWNISNPERARHLATVTAVENGAVSTVTLSPDGRMAVTGGQDKVARLWNLEKPGKPFQTTHCDHAESVWATALTRDGRLLATGGVDRTVRLWDTTDPTHTPVLLHQPGDVHASTISGIAFSPDRRLLAIGGYDSTIQLWDVSHPRNPHLRSTLVGHLSRIYDVAFSPHGNLLGSVSADRTARLWDVSSPRSPQPVATLSGHQAGVEGLAFHPTLPLLSTVGDDGTIRSWDTRPKPTAATLCERAGAVLTAPEWDRLLPGLPYHRPCPGTGSP
ncbi:nSTAND1 domain-containing NTPase [Streptomyces sp. NPDC002276]